MSVLAPFPVDDITIDLLDDALSGSYQNNADGEPELVGGEFSLIKLLDLLSGYDPALRVQVVNEYDQPIPDDFHYQGEVYHVNDVVSALTAEVRRLRATQQPNGAQ